MASTLILSKAGLEIIDRARKLKGWNKAGVAWQVQAEVAKSTLDRFWMQKPIKQQNFVAICAAVGVSDWEQIADLPPIASVPARRGSNLGQVHEPAILELDGFAQQVFGWFQALGFDRESDPRRDGNYVEWVIKVVMRSRVDRVLIRAIIHEVGLGDLDGLRRSVADLRVDEGWLVTSLWVSPAVKQVLNKSEEGLTCLTFDELIDQDANFAPYVAWLEAEVRRRELEKYYVPLGCTKGEFDGGTKTLRAVSSYPVSEGGIDLYIDRWLENPMTEHVSVLGEFGTGKTWFVLHYAGRCLRAYLEAKQKGLPRPRLPLVIPLRDYAKALNVENVLAGFFYTQHNIRLNSAVFDRLNQMGKLLLIFDGFDEMADKVDHQKMIDNFWELAKVVTTNAKVILTCRTEHFPTAQVGRDTLRGELLASTARLTGVPPQFETLELMKFDDVQIREVLGRRTNELTVEKVMGNGQVLDLLRRAVMAEFVLEALPEIEAGKEIDLARVYLYAVWRKMERDIKEERTFTSLADKLYFLCEISWEMLLTDRMSLNYREFPAILQKLFGKTIANQKDLDHWHYDMMGQTMLVRNDGGDYSPAHRSLLEFFVAYKFAAELGLLDPDFLELVKCQSRIDNNLNSQLYTWSNYWQRDIDDDGVRGLIAPLNGFIPESLKNLRGTFGRKPLTKTILKLLLLTLNLQINYRKPNPLLDLIKLTDATDTNYVGGNAATVLVKLEPLALESQDLRGTNLAHADLVNAGLRRTNLSGSNLEGCLMTRAFGAANTIIMSKDDRRIITAHDDNTIRIWDRSNGKELHKLVGHHNHVHCLSLGENGEFLYSGSDDGTIKEWELSDSICRRTLIVDQSWVRTIILSADNKLLYYGNEDGTIKECRIADGVCQRIFEGHEDSVSTITLSSDGQLLYSGSKDRTIKEWRIADNICQKTFEGHQNQISAIVLSADNRLLYSSSSDCTIKEWIVDSGICQKTFKGHQNWIRSIVLSLDDKLLYSGSGDLMIKEWRIADGVCQRTFEGHQDRVSAITLSADGKSLYSGSYDRTIKEWGIIEGSCQQTFDGYQDWVRSIAVSSDGKTLYSGSHDRTIKAWEIVNKICQQTFKGHQDLVRAIALSADGQILYSGSHDKMIKVWDIETGKCIRTFEGHQDWVMTIALSLDGRLLYSGSDDRTIKVWDIETGKCIKSLDEHQDWVRVIVVSPDGQFLYSGSGDRTIKKWKIADGTCLQTFDEHQNSVMAVTLSPDGKYLYSGSDDRTIKVWDVVTGKCIDTFEGHQDWVRVIAVSPNGKLLYSGSGDRTIKEWRIADKNYQRTFEGHQDWVRAISLSADGQTLYSGSDDRTIKVWSIMTGKCIDTIDPRLCADANITGTKGLTPAQTDALIALGAFDENIK
jgi:WD40 repeat protein